RSLPPHDFLGRECPQSGHPRQAPGAPPVEVHFLCEILGRRRKVVGQQVYEYLTGSREQGVIRLPLLADGRGTFRTHLTAAERTRAMGGIDLRIVRKRQELLMKALVQDRGELLWGMGCREVRPAHVTHEESVSGEDG